MLQHTLYSIPLFHQLPQTDGCELWLEDEDGLPHYFQGLCFLCLPALSMAVPCTAEVPRVLSAKINWEWFIAEGGRAATCVPRILGIPLLARHVFIRQDPGGSSPVYIDFQGYIWLCFVFGQWREYQVNVLCSDA